MKQTKTKNQKPLFKPLKKIYYEARGIGIRSLISFVLVGGILLSVIYSTRLFYTEYASAHADIDLFYHEIADAQYPDKSRFTYYDFADMERIEEALAIMQANGKYMGFTAEDIQDDFYIYSKLDSSVRDNVEWARSEGADFSYVGNEYGVDYIQPHDYDNENLLARFFPKDDSVEFLQVLMDVNYKHFVETIGGVGGFKTLTDVGDLSGYDYGEQVDVLDSRINFIIDALDSYNKGSDGFVSVKHDRTLMDLVGEYKLLLNKLGSISDFIESSGLTRDIVVERNKLATNLESNELYFNKSDDRYNINKTAEEKYDHTFTENLIVVSLDDYKGLYQARPKTAFDEVALSKNAAMEDRAYFNSVITDIRNTLATYDSTVLDGTEYERLCRKCESLQTEFLAEYTALSAKSAEVISEYYAYANKGFLSYTVESRGLVGRAFFVNNALMFFIGGICAFILYVVWNSYIEHSKYKKKEKMLKQLRAKAKNKKKEA